ncbi:hypothetical protein [Saccharothrix coeruleofusca]|uniref:hypothetical protein n=1 Tax=Saccharothrix coeruleofusca TaxID=33919 RepID=UPI0016712D9E|nr:hypothetical protein [Saccharothrix coeruleofusca]MBP2340084.1 hypothetical protein [Saccharothrix coeruleofusca]
MTTSLIAREWTDRCLARADRRAVVFIAVAVASFGVLCLVAAWLDSKWVFALTPLCVEFAVPGLRHFCARRRVRALSAAYPWERVAVAFVPGRARVGWQSYLETDRSDRTFLRLPALPERVRDHLRRTGEVWMAGPDEHGRAAVLTRGKPFLTLGRVVVR